MDLLIGGLLARRCRGLRQRGRQRVAWRVGRWRQRAGAPQCDQDQGQRGSIGWAETQHSDTLGK